MTIIRWFISKTVRNACAVKKHYRRLLAAQSDLLSSANVAAVQIKLDELTAAIREGHTGRMNIKAEELQFAAEKNLKPYWCPAWRENVEVLLVALAVAMAIRTFFIQPFKIPTGSMQPTLFGVTAYPDYSSAWYAARFGTEEQKLAEFRKKIQEQKNLVIPTGWERVKEWLKGNSYIHFVAPVDGMVESIGPVNGIKIVNVSQKFTFAGQAQTIWSPPDYGEGPSNLNPLQYRAGLVPGRVFRKGEDVIKLRMSAGDHLFVDRLIYNFRKPTRGETIVFATLGINNPDAFGGNLMPQDQFYIKRLTVLPNERASMRLRRILQTSMVLILTSRRPRASSPATSTARSHSGIICSVIWRRCFPTNKPFSPTPRTPTWFLATTLAIAPTRGRGDRSRRKMSSAKPSSSIGR
jgi:signal peptidase I